MENARGGPDFHRKLDTLAFSIGGHYKKMTAALPGDGHQSWVKTYYMLRKVLSVKLGQNLVLAETNIVGLRESLTSNE